MDELRLTDGQEPAADQPEAETETFTDGIVPETEVLETYSLTVAEYQKLMVSSISLGVFSGAIFMIVGLAVYGIVKIFKKT